MSFIDSIRNAFAPSESTKAPTFQVSNTSNWQDYTRMADSMNYLEQFESWTYKAVTTIADAITNYPQKLIDKDNKEVEQDNLLFDLIHPNDHLTYNDLRKIMAIHIKMTGSAYWVMTESDRPKHKVDFFPLDPTKMTVKTDAFGLPSLYKFQTINGNFVEILPENLIIFKQPDPRNWLKGFGALQASRYAHNTYELASKFNMNFFGNSGRPEGFLVFEGIADEEKAKIEAQLRQKYQGVRNSRRIGVLNTKPEFIEMIKTQKDLDFVEGLKMMRDEILAIQGVPKTLVGLDDTTYANAEQALRIFQQYTLQPMLQLEADVYNHQLLPKYYGNKPLNVEFKPTDPVEIDMGKQVINASTLYEKGLVTRNEAREMVGEDAKEDGDEFYSAPVPNYAPQMPVNDEQNAKMIDSITSMQKAIERHDKTILAIPDVKEQADRARDEMRAFYMTKSLEGEKSYAEKMVEYFNSQEKRVIKELSPKKAVNIDFGLNWGKEIDLLVAIMQDEYVRQAIDWNKYANEITNARIAYDSEMTTRIRKNLDKMSTLVTNTTKDEITKVIAKGIDENWTLEQTKTAIKDLYQLYTKGNTDAKTDSRAEMIARTEVNSIKNDTLRWNYAQNKNVEAMQWLSAHDNFVRDAHRQADGQTIKAGTGAKFYVGGERLAYPCDKSGSPENTINCLVPETQIAGDIIGASKAFYSGKIIKIITSGGKTITVTPNHPVLTDKGFVFAKDLVEGQNLVAYTGKINDTFRLVDNDVKEKPTTIENVFSSLNMSFPAEKLMVTGLDFNGDFIGQNTEIDIININRKLSDNLKSIITQNIEKFGLVSSDPKNIMISRFSPKQFFLSRNDSSPASDMSMDALVDPLLGTHERPFKFLRLGLTTQLESSLYKSPSEGNSSDSELLGELIQRDAGLIQFENIVKIEVGNFSGHVYDVTTMNGLIIAQGIVTSNCRCTTVAIVADDYRSGSYSSTN